MLSEIRSAGWWSLSLIIENRIFETMASVNSHKIAQRGLSPPSFAGFPETDFCLIYSTKTYPMLRFGGLLPSFTPSHTIYLRTWVQSGQWERGREMSLWNKSTDPIASASSKLKESPLSFSLHVYIYPRQSSKTVWKSTGACKCQDFLSTEK